MKFARTRITILVLVLGFAAGGALAERRLAATPSPINLTKADSPPQVAITRPRRPTVAQHLQTNATLAAFEEADLFAKVSGYLSDVRVDIGDHVKAGQVLAVIDVPEMKQELAEAEAQLESKKSLLEWPAPFPGNGFEPLMQAWQDLRIWTHEIDCDFVSQMTSEFPDEGDQRRWDEAYRRSGPITCSSRRNCS